MIIDISKLPTWAKIEVTKGDLMAFAETIKLSNPVVKLKSDEDEFLTMDEAASFLKLAKQSLYGMTSRKEIRFYKRGKFNFFRKADLIEFIEMGRQNTNSEATANVLEYIRNNNK